MPTNIRYRDRLPSVVSRKQATSVSTLPTMVQVFRRKTRNAPSRSSPNSTTSTKVWAWVFSFVVSWLSDWALPSISTASMLAAPVWYLHYPHINHLSHEEAGSTCPHPCANHRCCHELRLYASRSLAHLYRLPVALRQYRLDGLRPRS